MKKIGIVTITNGQNYGNRLQNYALQKVITRYGIETETLQDQLTKKRQEKKYRNLFRYLSAKIYFKLGKKKNSKLNKILKEITFNDFNKEYIKFTNLSMEDADKNFDAFIVGSDQVWNPNFNFNTEREFLTFISKKKRLTYAPSFGISEIPDKYINNYKSWLKGFENISVREEAGAQIIEKLTDKKALVVIDPTMLLSKEEWIEVSKKDINKPKQKYLLTYFLGETSVSVNEKIEGLIKKYDLKLVNLANINQSEYYSVNPSEFVDYINDAEVFVTDSFHGCVFSLLMDTPLVVCDRVGQTSATSMSSRIETFVNKFYIQDRQFKNIKEEEIFKTNYKKAYEILEVERKKSFDYLESILKVKVTQ